jgi:nucleotide-binding universal stress UspA family protein
MLLAVDGSEEAMKTVEYAIRMKPFHLMRAVLFNVFSAMPESFWDLGMDSHFGQAAREIHAWEVEQKRQMEMYMKTAQRRLIEGGFSGDRVKAVIHKRKKGVARDIIQEAQDGFEWIMVGRKGQGKLKEIVLGSVAVKLLEKINFIPVILVGDAAPNDRILIAVDGSENALRAVKFVGNTLGGSGGFTVTLIHVIRGAGHGGNFSHLFTPHEFDEAAVQETHTMFETAITLLRQSGFEPGAIETRLITGVPSRAAAIVQEARQNQYGTIVVGRRGISKVQEFFMGRVGNKIVNMAKDHTVWVVT